MKKRSATLFSEDSGSRRQFLQLASYATLGLFTGGYLPFLNQIASGQSKGIVPATESSPHLDISLTAQTDEVALYPGEATRVWRYRATLNKGGRNRLIELPGSYLGPIIKAHQGEKVRIHFTNSIPEESIVHWHGLHVPSIMDGHPRDAISQGKSYFYEFEVKNRAGTYWYHPHPHGKTGPQVYGGLAGLLIVSDQEEKSLGLPDNEFDVPLVIQDRTFDENNQLVYLSGHRMQQMTGFLGESILVNGTPDFTLPASATAYRLRILNGSNSRIYRLAWEDGRPLTIIGTDGGLLEKPVSKQYVFLAPGERLEIWADFTGYPIGYETAVVSLPFNDGGARFSRMGRGMRGGMTGNFQDMLQGVGFSVFKVKVTSRGKKPRPLPMRLSTLNRIQARDAVNFERPKRFHLSMGHMQWTINGRVFQMDDVADDELVYLGSKEIWEFASMGGGMMHMMDMPHPIHLHGKQFRVLARSGVRHEGYVDEGWKDTVLVMPGERVQLLVHFDDYPGMFLYHCHNLEHEDMGMMRNYFIRQQAV